MSRNKYPEETVGKILDVAEDLFQRKGYERTSIQDIVDGLGGLTRGAVFHHFASKEDILDAVFARQGEPLHAAIKRVKANKALSGLEKLHYVFNEGFNFKLLDTLARIDFVPDAIGNARMFALTYHQAIDTTAHEEILPLIEEGIRDGSIVCKHPREMAEIMMLLANTWLSPAFCSCDREHLIARSVCYTEILRSQGLDIVDEETMQQLANYVKA